MKRSLLIFFAAVIISALCACESISNSKDNSLASSSVTTTHDSLADDKTPGMVSDAKKSHKTSVENEDWIIIDKSVTVKGLDYTVNAYKKSEKSESFEADKGRTFLLIDITVKNNLKKTATINSKTMFDLTDRFGTLYNNTSLGAISCLDDENMEQLDGHIAASSEVRGGIAYEVPKVTKGLRLIIQGPDGDGRTPVILY
ncbi:Telomeric repeat-binding factor 2 [Ruminiclostridium papyrosolvens DSM 2782]|uniref:Telomeric repeat-binding factor 2 n=1 Tax=Ruminiclostridium papyrosolvens DSM 2782 TaxID=588581 RepID=F1TE62_9FIRM|nr:DUF4352 domain-containing protein [Ruminiclostridium papyrosolvens]EGD47302.1 Telomeric repeat-binding factor 2 [Ruminiclostridium papyrosolvens DSM 2782]WES34648.1 DUF4352 domain-containing protein [Ruminiclostridium papyrosolvens DSM 2782]